MLPHLISNYYEESIAVINQLSSSASPWAEKARQISLDTCYESNTDTLLRQLHDIQRLRKIHDAGLANNQEFFDDVARIAPLSWKNFIAPPATADLQESLAQKLYNAGPGDKAIITLGSNSRQIGPSIVEKCMRDNVPFIVQFDDPDFNALIINHADEIGIKALASSFVAMTSPMTKRIVCAAGLPETEPLKADKEKSLLYARETKPYMDRVRSGDLFYTLTVIPTEKDAEIDSIDYRDYINLFFEMCDQPWDLVSTAQQELIKEFDTAKAVRITNDDGTDISMDIDGFTFCNSLIAKNVPGSEIFSAPRRDSVEGRIVAKGKFLHDKQVIENLTLEFNKGHLVSYSADSGLEAFEKAISVDDNARYIGELGIGTNPHLKRHVANGLLVEKIGGSFHLALGASYSFKEYAGAPVSVDNGNSSALHWDITTMLYGKGGCIYLDGRKVMDNGLWLNPKYDVLNRGWATVPQDQRPAHWKNYIGPAGP